MHTGLLWTFVDLLLADSIGQCEGSMCRLMKCSIELFQDGVPVLRTLVVVLRWRQRHVLFWSIGRWHRISRSPVPIVRQMKVGVLLEEREF